EPLALADGEMRNALVAAEHIAIDVDDVARIHRIRPEPRDDICIAPGRHEADVLTVVLVGDREAEAPREIARLLLGHVAERKAQILKLLARGREQEIALVTLSIRRTNEGGGAVGKTAGGDIMTGRKRRRAELACGLEQVAKLDRAVAFDARYRRLSGRVAFGEDVDHRFLEAVLIVQHIMRDP